jgi:hypothetical protein
LYHFNIACPVKNVKLYNSKSCKWVTDEVIRKKQNMFDYFSKYKKSLSCIDKLNYHSSRNEYRLAIQKAKADWMESSLLTAKNKSKQAWKIIDSFRNKKLSNPKNMKLNIDGKTVVKPRDVCEEFNNYFVTIAEKTKQNIVSRTNSPRAAPVGCRLEKFDCISKTALEKNFSRFSSKTSSGYDEISMMVLKHCREEILDPLLFITNKSLLTGIFPEKCKLAKIKPLFKKDDETQLGNHRPISLLPALSKVFERVVCEQLTHYLETNELICKKQYGFRKNRSTKLALIDFVNQCIDALDAGETVMGCYADLSKAFDCVDTKILLKKLESLGISSLALKWLTSFTSNRKQFTEIQHQSKSKIKNFRSNVKPITSGVPQGSILGPVLFLVYVNDMPGAVPDENLFMFADDTTLFTKNKKAEQLEVETFVKINQLAQYFSDNLLSLNSAKTGCLRIQTHQRSLANPSTNIDVFIDEVRLNHSDSVDFLGVRLDGGLAWSNQIEKIEKKISSGLFVLRRTSQLNPNLNLSKLVYYSLIESHIVYSIALWGGYKSHLDKIFVMQKKAIRTIFKLPPWSSCSPYFRQTNILTVPCLFIFELVMYIKNQQLSSYNQRSHNYNTRHRNKYSEYHRLSVFEKKPLYLGLKFYQALPTFVTDIVSQNKFRSSLKNFLMLHCFYEVDGFLDHSKTCNPNCPYLTHPST